MWVALGPVGNVPCLLTLQMECEAERRPLGVFECQLCALTAPYSYVGQQPPGAQSVAGLGHSAHRRHFLSRSLLEESYVMRDPFTPSKDRFLILGSRCSDCSLFYSKRFCLPCVRENIDAFPQEIQQDLEKRKVPSKRPASQPGSRT
ncbi:cysteine-rich DPF motif domain-containing protein 1 isoform X2 [Lagenorhynchus albirostris]|uniref:cysteine-rich DPF motif domain-containing protein 1 isoform X2 n=1 Tax=Lagenorhynchus albirostris TaxID=27610 RepID=UPI0028ED735C|nr:cysteine-rich DPF motif domain-containing protein 1 isoform X2 [Lagenorhynchus albirostris]